MTVPAPIVPPAHDEEESALSAKMRRRGLFAAAAAVFAGIVTRTKEVAALAGGGVDGNLVLGSHFANTPNTAHQTTIVAPGSGTWNNLGLLFDAETNYGTGVANMNALYGHAKGTGSGVVGVSSGFGTGHHSTDLANTGVIGYGSGPRIGVAGISDTNWGVLGQSGTGGVGVYGISPFAATVGLGQGTTAIGIWGQTDGSSGYGVYGNATTTFGIGVYGQGNPWAAAFSGGVFVNGALTVVNGAKSAAVPHPDGSLRRLYCVESPESWFEDFGTGSLVNGVARVKFDPDFAAVVKNENYHVFLSPEGECHGLFVDGKKPDGFDVRERKGGQSNLTFSYRIVAKRKDIAGPRFEKVESPNFFACDQVGPLEVPKPFTEVASPAGSSTRP